MTCVALFCDSRCEMVQPHYEEISFHVFPKDPNTRNIWIAAINRKNWTPSSFSKLCSKHFEESCFVNGTNKKLLKNSAVPTLFTTVKRDVIKKTLAELERSQSLQPFTTGFPAPSLLCDDDDNAQIQSYDDEVTYYNQQGPKRPKITQRRTRKSVSLALNPDMVPRDSLLCAIGLKSESGTSAVKPLEAQVSEEIKKSFNKSLFDNGEISSQIPEKLEPQEELSENEKILLFKLRRTEAASERRRKIIKTLQLKNKRLIATNAKLNETIEHLESGHYIN